CDLPVWNHQPWLLKKSPSRAPRGVPLVGNVFDIDGELPLRSFNMLADQYGEIFRLTTFGKSRVFISSQELVNEACDESRFTKGVLAALQEIRDGTHDGLFTAHYPEEENWAVAHRILVPAFGPLMIREMFDDMYDIASQLAMKWARQGPDTPIQVTDDFTRLTLDTIALCSMGTRFNSYYHDEMHPFIAAMTGFLVGSGHRARVPTLLKNLPTSENTKFYANIDYMRKLSQELIDDRKNHPQPEKKDLMNALLLGRDPQTGKGLSDESVIDNMITFLIAGHETTSGMLSFLFYYLLKTPYAYKKAQEEVDTVIGRRKISVDDMSKLPYLTAVMRETLRIQPSVTIVGLRPHPTKNKEDPVTLGGKYVLHRDETIAILINKLHQDPKVYGADADEFKPERMLDEHFNKLPKNSWKPFGNGMRGCIGRPFAWQEALLTTALLLQNFNFSLANPSYDLRIKQTLTIKPKDFQMKATLRNGLDPTNLNLHLSNTNGAAQESNITSRDKKPMTVVPAGKLKPMYIFYGSNTGTCEAFAHRLAQDAPQNGFEAKVTSLDSALQNIPTKDPVVFITASYEGQPPDNAAHFFEWLSELKGDSLKGVDYATFGCGHHDWASTFHRIPKLIDELVESNGGHRLCSLGTANAAEGDMFTAFDSWGDSTFWPAVTAKFGGEKQAKPGPSLEVEVTSGRASSLGLNLEEAYVVDNQLLTEPSVPIKRCLRLKLPSDMTYQCGDYLAVLPVNPSAVTRRAISRFELPWDAVLRIKKTSTSGGLSPTIPLDTPISAFELLSTYVELSQPVSKRDLHALADAAIENADVQAELRYIASSPSKFASEIVQKRSGNTASRRPPSPTQPNVASPSPCSTLLSLSANEETERYLGVASTFLSQLQPGERVQVTVRPSHSGFKPPIGLQTPMIMACAGSGLAPFRGFVMDRAEKIRGRRSSLSGDSPQAEQPAKAILYAGCRTQGKDDIHAAEFAEWAKIGAVDIRWAYSRPETGPGQHVQDRMQADSLELIELFEQGANFYVCGSTGVGAAVREAIKGMFLEKRAARTKEKIAAGEEPEIDPGLSDEEAADVFFDKMRAKERYATDVFT
ncbi:hypothetical protein N7468_009577, partial [Penicillium chermesinum]